MNRGKTAVKEKIRLKMDLLVDIDDNTIDVQQI